MKNHSQYLFKHFCDNQNRLLASDSRLRISPERDDIIICPLCFNKFFTIDSFSKKELTLEHAPPHKVGGKVVALTCSACNHEHGSSLDKHLVQFVQNLDALSGAGSTYVDTYVQATDGREFRAEFRVKSENNFELLGVPKASNIKHIEHFTSSMQSQDFRFKLRLHMGNERRAQLSLLRAGYLIAFHYLGYGFLVNFNLGYIRQQLITPDKNIIPEKAIHFPIKIPDKYIGINIIKEPPELKCYFIVFDIQAKNGISRRVGVMLPGPNSEDFSMFKTLDTLSQIEITSKHFDIKFDDKIDTPWLAHSIWNLTRE